MIKRFCDICGKESPSVTGNRLSGDMHRNGRRILWEVTCGIDGTWNSGDLCKACLVEAILHDVGAKTKLKRE